MYAVARARRGGARAIAHRARSRCGFARLWHGDHRIGDRERRHDLSDRRRQGGGARAIITTSSSSTSRSAEAPGARWTWCCAPMTKALRSAPSSRSSPPPPRRSSATSAPASISPAAYRCWGLNIGKFGSSHEGEFDPRRHHPDPRAQPLRPSLRLRHRQVGCSRSPRPICSISRGCTSPGAADGGLGLQLKLSPSLDDFRIAVHTRIGSPIVTPWRVVMLADRPANWSIRT